ncbi:hypothetical protein FGO68_gene17644 [Halteria grandinella]|uniref:non-specific serine/threonine protein kinase n=1 Tax=Halteria grandinella TaxID=5974 RepID=A0A8J8NUR9_HALGN|nr:hypothetical protein FGO68_gene17644 [Halteria grandinella]
MKPLSIFKFYNIVNMSSLQSSSKLSDFAVLQEIGKGAYSSVLKARRHQDGKVYAIKKIEFGRFSKKERDNALLEISILSSIKSNNIIHFHEAFLDGENDRWLCIVMDFADGGDLLYKIKSKLQEQSQHVQEWVDQGRDPMAMSTGSVKEYRFEEMEVWSIAIQMVMGIKALHDRSILHRDLKSANIFVYSDGTVKIGDLNVSKIMKEQLSYTQTGTPYYASPEVWRDKPYDFKSDIWSLGVIIYEVATLVVPFKADNIDDLYKRVCRGVYAPISRQYSPDLSALIKKMIQLDPFQRPSCNEILTMPSVRFWMTKLGFYIPDPSTLPLNRPFRASTVHHILTPYNASLLKQRLPEPNYAGTNTQRGKSALERTVEYVDSFTTSIKAYPHRKSTNKTARLQQTRPLQESNFQHIGMSLMDFTRLTGLQKQPQSNQTIEESKDSQVKEDQTIKPLDLSASPLDAIERIRNDIQSKRTIEQQYKGVSELYSPSKANAQQSKQLNRALEYKSPLHELEGILNKYNQPERLLSKLPYIVPYK